MATGTDGFSGKSDDVEYVRQIEKMRIPGFARAIEIGIATKSIKSIRDGQEHVEKHSYLYGVSTQTLFFGHVLYTTFHNPHSSDALRIAKRYHALP